MKNSEIINKNQLCIGIGGVSRSGKTFLSNLLYEVIPDSVVIHQDTYIPEKNTIPKIKNHIDWECPEAIHWKNFREAVETALHSGKNVIVEGLFAFHDNGINKFYNKTIYIDLTREEFIFRKKNDLRWGREPIWYIKHIWESHLVYGLLPSNFKNTLKLNGETDFDINLIQEYLRLDLS